MIQYRKYSDREEWKRLRADTVGGSEAGAIMNEDPYESRYSLWCARTGKTKGFAGSPAARLGTELENMCARRFCEKRSEELGTPVKVRRVRRTIFNTEVPFAHANLDRVTQGERAIVECKTTAVPEILAAFEKGEVPRSWFWQVQHYMMVADYDHAYICVLDRVGRYDIMYRRVERDAEAIEQLRAAEAEFIAMVREERAPEMTGHPAEQRSNRERWAGGDSDILALDAAWSGKLASRAEYKARAKEIDGMIRAIDAELQAAIRDHEEARCPGWRVTWKQQKTAAVDWDRLRKDHPEVDPGEYRVKSRVLRVSEKKGVDA